MRAFSIGGKHERSTSGSVRGRRMRGCYLARCAALAHPSHPPPPPPRATLLTMMKSRHRQCRPSPCPRGAVLAELARAAVLAERALCPGLLLRACAQLRNAFDRLPTAADNLAAYDRFEAMPRALAEPTLPPTARGAARCGSQWRASPTPSSRCCARYATAARSAATIRSRWRSQARCRRRWCSRARRPLHRRPLCGRRHVDARQGSEALVRVTRHAR